MSNPDNSIKDSDKSYKLTQLSSKLIGEKLGEYEVKKEIGRGGTSLVYEAYQPSLKRFVALKVLWTPFINNPSLIERFHREAEAAANLHHPNIVPIYALGKEKDFHYFAMEKIEGEALSDILEANKEISAEKAVQIIKEVAKAVSYAHLQGIVHRDIKPSNIMIDKMGRISVTDFGLVKSKKWKKVTSSQTVLGTPVYMSPEQAQGEETDARTDIYSLGVVLYQILTHRIPFDADEPVAILRKVIEEDPLEPRGIKKEIPKKLETIILKCLEKKPEKRYQTMGLFLRDLELYKANLPLMTKRTRITFFAKKRRKVLIKAGLLLIIVLFFSGLFLSYVYFGKGYQKIKGAFSLINTKVSEVSQTRIDKEKIEEIQLQDINLVMPKAEDLADVVYLKNGKKIRGIVEKVTKDEVAVRLEIGTLTYPRHQVNSIEYSTPKNRQMLEELWQTQKRKNK